MAEKQDQRRWQEIYDDDEDFSMLRLFTDAGIDPAGDPELEEDAEEMVTLLVGAIKGTDYPSAAGLDDDGVVAIARQALRDPQQAPIYMMTALGLSVEEALDFNWVDILLLPGGRLVVEKQKPAKDCTEG